MRIEDPRIIVGARYIDDSHDDVFTITRIEYRPEAVISNLVHLDNGQTYEMHGPQGFVAKLDAGLIRLEDPIGYMLGTLRQAQETK